MDKNGITIFNSVGDIRRFLKNYDNEKEALFFTTERDFDLELDTLQAEGFHLQKHYDTLKSQAETKLNDRINNLKTKCTTLSGPAKNAVMELLHWYQLQCFLAIKFLLVKSFNKIIKVKTHKTQKHLKLALERINHFAINRQEIISARCSPKFKELEHAKTTVTALDNLIAGAIGENLVAKELEKLSDDYVLINDFSLSFEKPIYNKKENDRIFSIQIDHLLVTHAGIFIIETKNWSKASVARNNLRSPVQQIQRANFALFVLLNGNKQGNRVLKQHHWGHKKLTIRSIVAMIHHRPKEQFNYVAIKTLRELNGYIERFEPIFDTSEVRSIADYLMGIKN
ncbi:hypothetical protein HME9304_00628 [Flagellimonas maritima]|uniref:NERD domain-containing protein n=1 Tax=Flagellimonas maritima TaxID=1383885 RepID=A0A2Z4LQW0_9FLAO|nr:hypothetical protein HME9304_00628 [Allomuricauda aurantiaca]